VARLGKYPVKLLAEKVDNRDVYQQCLHMGFELFQGYFFARPTLMQKRRVEDSSTVLFELLQKLSLNADTADIAPLFKKSPALTYKLLLLVNSVSFGMREKITSVQHAISLIGLGLLKRWVQLAIFASDDGTCSDSPLINMVGIRATLMEGLARLHPGLKSSTYAPEQAFMTGTLSILTDFYEIRLEEIMANLNLSGDVQDALAIRGGYLGELLFVTELVEQLHLDAAAECLNLMGIDPEAATECQKHAFNWQNNMG